MVEEIISKNAPIVEAIFKGTHNIIPDLISWWQQGYDVVYAYRKEDNSHVSFFARVRSKLFYKIINSFSDLQMEDGISDFKLLDKKVVNTLTNCLKTAHYYVDW
ncbi:MAG: hypothetical protein ABIY62_06935 [Ginsengibacter sp.]